MPVETSPQKIKKSADSLVLQLVRTPDILAEVAAHAKRPRCVVGFAAETSDVDANARDKLVRKQLDMIAANDVSAGQGFDCEENALAVITRDERHVIPRAAKPVVAAALLRLVAAHLEAGA
jgi:phosphopantothenoylcysteine decarboxylase/phosphopantothenate--cysteine ligase